MRYVRNPEFSTHIDILMGQPSKWSQITWCPTNTHTVYFALANKTWTGLDLKKICVLSHTAYSVEDIRNLKWIHQLKALEANSQETIIDVDETLSFIRQNTLIFNVPNFRSLVSKK